MSETFVGKESVPGWYENLIQNNIAIEFRNAYVQIQRLRGYKPGFCQKPGL